MDCNVIKDLLPLYIDKCCSEESSELVREHLESCPACSAEHTAMIECIGSVPKNSESTDIPAKLSRIDSFKASILQSVLLFISFAVITAGVASEAMTDYDDFFNGISAIFWVVPSTGFMLSLANWYFLPLYKSRRQFSIISCLLTFIFALIALLLTTIHYEMISCYILGLLICLVPTLIYSALSWIFSNIYAKKLGKE